MRALRAVLAFGARVVVGRAIGQVLQSLGVVDVVVAIMMGAVVGVWAVLSNLPGVVVFVLVLLAVGQTLNLFLAVVTVLEWVRSRKEGGWRDVSVGGRHVKLTGEAQATLSGKDTNQKRRFSDYVRESPKRRFYAGDVVAITGAG